VDCLAIDVLPKDHVIGLRAPIRDDVPAAAKARFLLSE
jgi:hypothetical protein